MKHEIYKSLWKPRMAERSFCTRILIYVKNWLWYKKRQCKDFWILMLKCCGLSQEAAFGQRRNPSFSSISSYRFGWDGAVSPAKENELNSPLIASVLLFPAQGPWTPRGWREWSPDPLVFFTSVSFHQRVVQFGWKRRYLGEIESWSTSRSGWG